MFFGVSLNRASARVRAPHGRRLSAAARGRRPPWRARPVRNSDDMGGMKNAPPEERRYVHFRSVRTPLSSLRTARLRRAAVLQELAPLQQMSCRLPGFIGPVPPPLLIRVEATCAIQLSRRSPLRVVYPRLAAVSTKNFALSARGGRGRKRPARFRRSVGVRLHLVPRKTKRGGKGEAARGVSLAAVGGCLRVDRG